MKQLLQQAFELIKQGHTTEAYARNAFGEVVAFDSTEACQFCSAGALKRLAKTENDYYKALWQVSDVTSKDTPYLSIIKANDVLPKEKVFEIWEKAIEGAPDEA